MDRQTEPLLSDIERRLTRLATADPFDSDQTSNSLAIAIEGLKLIRISRREPEAAKLAGQVLGVLRERESGRENDDQDNGADSMDDLAPYVDPDFVSPNYPTTSARDLARVEHGLTVLAESIGMRQSCSCRPGRSANPAEFCEPCRVIHGLEMAVADAREFLAGPTT
jgi:hypothetical protein